MNTEFYTVEAVQELQDAVSACADSIKYLYNLPTGSPSPELEEAFYNLVMACKDLQGSFEYYAR